MVKKNIDMAIAIIIKQAKDFHERIELRIERMKLTAEKTRKIPFLYRQLLLHQATKAKLLPN